MAKRGFLITFSAIGQEQAGVHRIRNWAEDLLRDVRRNGWGEVENPDTATDNVSVTASSPRALGDLAGAVKRSLRHHKLLDDAVVTKLVEPAQPLEGEASLSRKKHDE